MRNRFGLAVLPDSSIGGRSALEADRPTRADPGSTGEAGLHQDGKQPRAPFESPFGGEGDRLSRGSSVLAGRNGPTHGFAQPRRTPLARSRFKKRRGANERDRDFSSYFSPLAYLSFSPVPSRPSSLSRPFFVSYGVRVRASSRSGSGDAGDLSLNGREEQIRCERCQGNPAGTSPKPKGGVLEENEGTSLEVNLSTHQG